MTIATAAGTKFFIGPRSILPAPTTLTDGDFTEVGSVESLGEFGGSFQTQSFDVPLDDAGRLWVTQKRKVARDQGTIVVTTGLDNADAGQGLMLAAERDTADGDYAFKVVLNDGASSTYVFYGTVLSSKDTIGTADNVVRWAFTIAINSQIYS